MDKVEVVHSVWEQYAPNEIHSILVRNDKYYNIKLSDNTTRLLDLLLAMSDYEKFRELLQNLADVNATVPLDSPFWPGCTVLHLAVYMSENTKLWDEFFIKSDFQEILNLLFQISKNTEDDTSEYRNRIEICLQCGCSVTIKNADGLTPIHLAFKLHKTDQIINLLLNRCETNSDDSDDLSFLHIACAVENLDVVKCLLDKGADINRQTKVNFYWQDQSTMGFNHIPVNSTALHIATILENETMVKCLMNMEADIYAENSLGMTPIHFSLFSNKSIAQSYLKKAPVLRESVSNSGLSYLHIAAFADDTNAIEKLLQTGADIDRVFEDTKRGYCITPLQVAIKCQCINAITNLMKNGADILKQRADQGTSLLNLLRYLDRPEVHDFIENKLKLDQRFHEAIADNGMTLLHVACYMFDFEWADKLLKEGANVNAEIRGDSTNFDENWTGCTPMHLLIYRISRDFDDDGDEPKVINFVKLLIENGADFFATDYYDRSPLLLAHYLAREDRAQEYYDIYEYDTVLIPIADLLLKSQSSYDVNPENNDCFSHFHYACIRNEVDVVKAYLENGIDIDDAADIAFADQSAINFTPLHFAVYYRSVDVAYLLIEQGADVSAKTGDGDTLLHIAILNDLVDSDLFEMLLSHGADINAHSSIHSTPIRCYFDNCEITHKQLKLFRAYGALAYLNNESGDGLIRLDMNRAKPCDREAIFEELIDFCDVKNAVKNKLNPIENIVSVLHDDQITLSFYLNAIQRFINMGCKLDQKNKNGETALHVAIYRFANLVAIEALLLLGADVNFIKDNRPLFHEINTVKSKRIKKLFSAYVWKMELVGLKVPKLFDTTMLNIHEEYPLDEDLPQLCEDELARLSEINLGESVTIKDFLSECGLVKDYLTISSIQRENVDRFFLKFDEVRQNFPQFVGLLMMQYRKAVKAFDRFKMHEIAIGLLPSVIQVKLSRKLPYLCLKNILKYFSNDELDFFIKGQYSDGKIHVQSPRAGESKRKYVQVTN